MITFNVDENEVDKLKKSLNPSLFTKAIDIALFNIGEAISMEAKNTVVYKSGNLRRSIRSEVGNGYVKVGTDVVYAAIHEFGVTIKPKIGKYLRFPIDGMWVTVSQVKIPARPYLTPPFETMKTGRAIDMLSVEINKIIE